MNTHATLLCSAVALGALLLGASAPAGAAEHASWDAYAKKNRYKCPGPLDTLATPRKLTLAGKTYTHTGYRLEVTTSDKDNEVRVGILSAIKDTSSGTKSNLQQAFEWFRAEKVEWVVANGDLALEEFDLAEVVDILGASGFPVLVVLGNSESKGSWARTYSDRVSKYPNLINGTWVRQVVADDVEFWTMPGYHDKAFVHQGAGCLYKQEDVDLIRRRLTPGGKSPIALVAHGPPKGKGRKALDWILDKKNVGDPMLNGLLTKAEIPFGLFGHILEAGSRAVGKDMATAIPPKKNAKYLYVNAGSASGDPWALNDGRTSRGMAMMFIIKGKKASYRVKHFSPPPEE